MSKKNLSDTGPIPPHRRFDLKIRVQGDTWADVQDELERFCQEVMSRGPEVELVTGGVSAGGFVEVQEDPAITPEAFQEKLKEYNKAKGRR